MWDPDEVITKKIGKAAASWVITPTREGTESSAWQSSDNSGLIHHMGITQLSGKKKKNKTTKKF